MLLGLPAPLFDSADTFRTCGMTPVDDLVRLDSMPAHVAAFLSAAVVSGLNILISGATQAGNPACR